MSKPLDSRIEEAMARLPLLGWFDSRVSGDPVGYLHKILWVLLCGGIAWLLGVPMWWGGVAYLAFYTPLKVRGLLKHRRKYLANPHAVDMGPWKDRRPPPPWHTGYYTDTILDLLTAVTATLLLR